MWFVLSTLYHWIAIYPMDSHQLPISSSVLKGLQQKLVLWQAQLSTCLKPSLFPSLLAGIKGHEVTKPSYNESVEN